MALVAQFTASFDSGGNPLFQPSFVESVVATSPLFEASFDSGGNPLFQSSFSTGAVTSVTASGAAEATGSAIASSVISVTASGFAISTGSAVYDQAGTTDVTAAGVSVATGSAEPKIKLTATGYCVATGIATPEQSIISATSDCGLLFLYDDSINKASLSSSSSAAGFNVNDLQTNNINDIWMSSDTSDQVVTAIWTTTQLIDFIAIPFSNLIAGSSFRVRTYTSTSSSTADYDSGFINILYNEDPPIGFETIGYKSFAYGGGNHLSHSFELKLASKIDVTFRSPGNPDGGVQASRVMAGRSVKLARGASYGARVVYDDSTNVITTYGGGSIVDIKPNHKEIEFEIKHMPDLDRKQMGKMMRRVGRRIPIFVSLRNNVTDAQEKQHFEAFGYIENDGLTRTNYNLDSTKISIRQ